MARAEAVSEVQATPRVRRRPAVASISLAWFGTDWAAIILLFGLIALVVWNRAAYDMWVSRIDILQAYLPYYAFLGQQLRDFQIPGWNPHQFGGLPFAADPQSGWMQFPVMVLFALFDPVVGFKALMAFNIALGVFSTYALARIFGMRSESSFVGAIAFGFGNLIHYNTYCCTLQGNLAPWIPVSLLGVELTLRTQRWAYRLAGIFLTALALSQMLAAWIGQGAYYGFLVTAAYILYRTVISPTGGGWTARRRVLAMTGIGAAVFVCALLLAAAGVLPRFDVNRYTNLSGGNYEVLGATSGNGWAPLLMIDRILDSEFIARRAYMGTVAFMLALIAPFLVRKRYAVPFFAGLTVVCLILTLDTTPLHQLFYLLPKFQVLHQHSEWRILAVIFIGPAMLAAATVDTLLKMQIQRKTLIYALIPLVFYIGAGIALFTQSRELPIHVWIYVALVTLILVAFVLAKMVPAWRFGRYLRPLAVLLPFVLAFLLFLDPAGKEIVEAVRDKTSSDYYDVQFNSRTQYDQRIATYTDCKDKDGAGGFLSQQRDETGAPVRYFGYEPADLRTDARSGTSYQAQVASPAMQGILVGARATCLGLYDIQGYDPVQVKRYVDLLKKINGVKLNYHDAWILPSGIDSPLLPLLGPSYIIVPSIIPITDTRTDLSAVRQTHETVFNNQTVRVLAVPNALPHAWIVHEARQMPKDEILDALASGSVDPWQTAIVEVTAPSLDSALPHGADDVHFTAYGANSMAMDVNASSDGMLVLSEIYIPGWNAYVDGKKTDVYATDYALRGVALTTGNHHVELRYEPTSLRIGVLISAIASLAAVIVFAFALWTFWRDRRQNRLERGTSS
jgi:Bacterial membrane protein YfhO